MTPSVPSRDDWFEMNHGLPHPRWRQIRAWTRAMVPLDSLQTASHEAVRIWLDRLGGALEGKYSAAESDHFHLLSPLDASGVKGTLQFLESARKTILRVLGDRITPRNTVGKHVVIRFASHDEYYRYVSHFHSDGHRAGSGGMFLRGSGYMHIAHPPTHSAQAVCSVLAHELTHNLLCQLPLPLWLNEALAMSFEQDLSGKGMRTLDGDVVDKHRQYWNAETIQRFWMGRSFSSVKGQKVSYSLAATLIRIIANDIRPAPEEFRRFVLRADWEDAGMEAAREHLGLELEEIAATFLGPGDWRPKPETWKELSAEIEEPEEEDEEIKEDWEDDEEPDAETSSRTAR
jgi:hypothetical protein